MDETFVIPVKLRWPTAMFTLREIFYNEKLGYGWGLRSQGRFYIGPLLAAKTLARTAESAAARLKYRKNVVPVVTAGWPPHCPAWAVSVWISIYHLTESRQNLA
jgi:hypothetical protein